MTDAEIKAAKEALGIAIRRMDAQSSLPLRALAAELEKDAVAALEAQIVLRDMAATLEAQAARIAELEEQLIKSSPA